MKIVVDTSVAVKWFVNEVGREHARLFLKSPFACVAPELTLSEVANAIQRKVRLGEITLEQAEDVIEMLPRDYDDLVLSETVLRRAFDFSRQLDHSVYDCLYLAVAMRENDLVLVTDDGKFLSKAHKAGFEKKVEMLEAAYGRWLHLAQENKNG